MLGDNRENSEDSRFCIESLAITSSASRSQQTFGPTYQLHYQQSPRLVAGRSFLYGEMPFS
jgi:hypothetical protein